MVLENMQSESRNFLSTLKQQIEGFTSGQLNYTTSLLKLRATWCRSNSSFKNTKVHESGRLDQAKCSQPSPGSKYRMQRRQTLSHSNNQFGPSPSGVQMTCFNNWTTVTSASKRCITKITYALKSYATFVLHNFSTRLGEEMIDQVVNEVMSNTWLPLPLGLKPPTFSISAAYNNPKSLHTNDSKVYIFIYGLLNKIMSSKEKEFKCKYILP
ncbi:hypothetical protein RND71_018592 [Anisodus tanguticus]|uniref:Uncharacterized protein n=1 Tax=Anisodus tanguticus TaxID=243964 RepID=A0AAE1S6F5_9SOLA|nr:hypothetical protein RND71_018592 [Anisodus tanguticus]